MQDLRILGQSIGRWSSYNARRLKARLLKSMRRHWRVPLHVMA